MGQAVKKVLIVDDSEVVRKNLSRTLLGGGHVVTDASDGAAALKALGRERFDLILLDLQMPGLNGFELLRIIQAGNLAQDAPILVITGTHPELPVVHEIKKMGASGFIDKSASPKDILFRVSQSFSDLA